jgi:ribonuclease BN (tRNA processing enzyme)
VTYLGTGGYMIQRDNDAILLAPFFTNPGPLRTGIWSMSSDISLVNDLLDQAGIAPNGALGPSIEAILVGHAHFDHLLDIAAVVDRIKDPARVNPPPQPPTVFGSTTTVNTLAAAVANRASVSPIAVRANSTPAWTMVNNGAIRFVALDASHAPNVQILGVPITTSPGEVTKPRTRGLPKRARGWKEGQTLAYVIDFMQAGTDIVEFRIYYQDAAHEPDLFHDPSGFPGLGLGPGSDAAVDVAIICVAASNYRNGYVERLRDVVDPGQFILGHCRALDMRF